MREESAPRLVYGWYAGALLLESWHTSALLLESTQLLEICNPHSNETEMTHARGALAAICTMHCPCPAYRLAIAALERELDLGTGFPTAFVAQTLRDLQLSVLKFAYTYYIQHTEPLPAKDWATNAHSCTPDHLLSKSAHSCSRGIK